MMQDKNGSTPVVDVSTDTSLSKIDDKDVLEHFTRASGDVEETKPGDSKGGENSPKGTSLEEIDVSAEVNMEASITPDDVIRAGGFGARDDISSFLPVASDSTDFEASIRDARDYAEVNMEASITPDDVIRAGGFGARDDISCFLPVASDSTDFEASIRDARDYEEPQAEVSRPGLGWTGAAKGE